MKKILLLIVCSFHLLFVKAQKHEFLTPPKFNEADLTKEKSLLDESAPAEVLYRSTHFSIDYTTGFLLKKYFYRVKIYDKDKAEDWLNLEIPLYKNGNSEEKLAKVKAITYNLENGVVSSTPVEKNSKYKSKESKYLNITKLAFPNVKNGSVLEYQYEVNSPFLYTIPEIVVETNTPSLYTEYVLDNPANISYNINYTGSLIPKHKLVEDKFMYGTQYKTYRFGYENVKGFKAEKFVKNDRNYRTKISAELHSTNINQLKLYTSSWDKIKERLYNDEDFGGELKKTKLAKDIMPEGIAGLSNDIEKANAIFNYVQKNFTWNKEYGIYSEYGLKKLLETKTGNGAEINLLLVLMFREAGIKADPLLISTVNNGLINLVTPNLSNMNFVLAVINISEAYHLYDATSKQSSMDQLPPRDWNRYGILLSKDKAQQLAMENSKPSFTYLTANAKINADGSISGTYSDKDTGSFAMYNKEIYDENNEKYKKQYQDSYAIDFTNINSKVIDGGEFESTMNFSSENLIDRVGKKMIINPMLFLNKTSNEFDQTEARKYTIDFLSPYTRVKKVILELPEGYTIEELPKSKKIVTEDKEIEYSYVAEQKGNTIEVTATTKVASTDYPKEYYPAFKQIWGVASNNENQVINLIKK
ncbi:DUF3857 domain-containing protein [Chryseobacterium nematophagum]|uniref:DUF3857 domain-containing protein n=1 Tax=Chryseobacterium nematophagum TaxID=2305228 RepID=A0A3M7LAE2_9FLAO|nr:transglutaminase-like domain-containing protein [Chryseobacterium nematophagum]RMZ59733.1 DUF3857 domain-containing protein [Chryseobacterium nematophagum]